MDESRIRIVEGDITRLEVDAIVNAANEQLLKGGGVCGAIHDAAGPELEEECRKLGGCATGQAKVTGACQLPARYVIHTVGPVWHGGERGEPELLADAYRNSLALAQEKGVRTIAFPAISCGVFRYPAEHAARVAYEEVRKWTEAHEMPGQVIFCTYDAAATAAFRQAEAALAS